MATKSLSIDGMSCGHCINRVRESLSALPGVRSATVSISKKLAVIEVEEGGVSDAELIQAVKTRGFDVTDIR